MKSRLLLILLAGIFAIVSSGANIFAAPPDRYLFSSQEPQEWNSKDPKSFYKLGKSLQRMGEYGAAEEAFKRALELDSSFIEAKIAIGEMLVKLGQETEALALFEKIGNDRHWAKSARAEAYCLIGMLHVNQDRLDQALPMYHRAIELDPKYPFAHYNLGLYYEIKGDFYEARKAFRKAVELDGTDFRYLRALERIQSYIGQ